MIRETLYVYNDTKEEVLYFRPEKEYPKFVEELKDVCSSNSILAWWSGENNRWQVSTAEFGIRETLEIVRGVLDSNFVHVNYTLLNNIGYVYRIDNNDEIPEMLGDSSTPNFPEWGDIDDLYDSEFSDIVDQLIDAKEASRFLHISDSTLYKMARNKKIKHVRIGARVLFRRKDVHEYADKLAEKSIEA